MLNTFLCDELDTNALRLVYSKWRGESVDPKQLKLALSNCVSYGIYLVPDSLVLAKSDPSPMFSASDEEIDKAFVECCSVSAGPQDDKGAGGAFLKLLMPVLLKLLAGLLV